MWTLEYIFSQVCVAIAISLFVTASYIKNRKLVIFLNCFVNLFYAIQYALLGKYTGVLINAIGIIRCVWFYFDAKSNKKDYISLIVCSLLVIGGGIFTFSNWVDILAITASLIFTVGIWQSNLQIYRCLALVNNLCFIVFNLFCKSYLSVAFECVIIVMTVISIIKFHIEEKKNKNASASKDDSNKDKNLEKSENN